MSITRRSLFAALLSLIPMPFLKAKKKDDVLAVFWAEVVSREKTFERVTILQIPQEWRWLDLADLQRMMKERYPEGRESKLTAIWPHERIDDLDPRYYRRLA